MPNQYTVNKAGRPAVFDAVTIQKLENAFSWGCSDLEACLHADISIQSLYNYQNEHPEFFELKEKLKKSPTMIARKSVVKALPDDADLALKYLERKERNEFSLKTEVEAKVEVEKLSDEELADMAEKALKWVEYVKKSNES